jgi:hypothetical protein
MSGMSGNVSVFGRILAQSAGRLAFASGQKRGQCRAMSGNVSDSGGGMLCCGLKWQATRPGAISG